MRPASIQSLEDRRINRDKVNEVLRDWISTRLPGLETGRFTIQVKSCRRIIEVEELGVADLLELYAQLDAQAKVWIG